MMDIQTGEIYGKQSRSKFVMYNVIKVKKNAITLQNIENPLSLFETTHQKLSQSGYIRVSQTPYVDRNAISPKKRKKKTKLTRCPFTVDFIASRADTEKPTPMPDLFN